MNPKVCENWEKALQAFKEAKTAFENNEPDSEVKKKLWSAVVYGKFTISEFFGQNSGESLISSATLIESLSQFEPLGTKQAIDRTLKALNEYRMLIPKEYYLPVPTNC